MSGVDRKAVVLEKGQCGAPPSAERRDLGPGGGHPSSPPAAARSGAAIDLPTLRALIRRAARTVYR